MTLVTVLARAGQPEELLRESARGSVEDSSRPSPNGRLACKHPEAVTDELRRELAFA